jgi:hypothetical protein
MRRTSKATGRNTALALALAIAAGVVWAHVAWNTEGYGSRTTTGATGPSWLNEELA